MLEIFLHSEVKPSYPKTLTLFMTKICDNPYPVYDLTKNLKPYLWPYPYMKILFQTFVIISSPVQPPHPTPSQCKLGVLNLEILALDRSLKPLIWISRNYYTQLFQLDFAELRLDIWGSRPKKRFLFYLVRDSLKNGLSYQNTNNKERQRDGWNIVVLGSACLDTSDTWTHFSSVNHFTARHWNLHEVSKCSFLWLISNGGTCIFSTSISASSDKAFEVCRVY